MEHEEAREQAMLAMQSEDRRVRAAAVRGYEWQDDVREHAALRDADWRVRFLAVRQQSWEDPPAFMEAVANDPKPDVRKAAVPLLRDNPILARIALLDPDDGVREAAFTALLGYRFTVEYRIRFDTPEKKDALWIDPHFEGVNDIRMACIGWDELFQAISLAQTQTRFATFSDVYLEGRRNGDWYVRVRPEADSMVELTVILADGPYKVKDSCRERYQTAPDSLFECEQNHISKQRVRLPYRELKVAADSARIKNYYCRRDEYYERMAIWEQEDEEALWEQEDEDDQEEP
jgi:hypothetical protein